MGLNPQKTVDLVTISEDILNGKLPFLCSVAEELHKPIIRKFNKKILSITFYRQYLGCRSSRYAIDKEI